MSELNTAALAQFLHTSPWPALHEEQPTFFSIAGISHKELPLSNMYAFFFDSEEVHGLGSLFLQALLDTVAAKNTQQVAEWPPLEGPVRVAREYGVDERQRLDLLVHDGPAHTTVQGASYAVLIENKVNHWLANDLDNYLQSVRGAARTLGVVLGVRREYPNKPWVFVSHAELAQAVQHRLGPQLSRVHARYLPVLLHFLEHLTGMSEQNENFSLAFNFAQQHRQQLALAQRVLNELEGQTLGRAIVEAFGPGYEQQVAFDDRVDIRLVKPAPFRYIVYYGHILDLTKPSSFTITLYAPFANKTLANKWRTYLEAQAWIQQLGATKLAWFNFDALLVGKEYAFTGKNLPEFMNAVGEALQRDWQPQEESWVVLTEPPLLQS
jgi:hypothetical protein